MLILQENRMDKWKSNGLGALGLANILSMMPS